MKTEVIIYDYADLNVPMLAKMYGRRVAGYKAIGYEINEDRSWKTLRGYYGGYCRFL